MAKTHALHTAIWERNFEVVKTLLQDGADVLGSCSYQRCKKMPGRTPLQALFLKDGATRDETERLYGLLKEHGATLDLTSDPGRKLLSGAGKLGYVNMIQTIMHCAGYCDESSQEYSELLHDVIPLHNIVKCKNCPDGIQSAVNMITFLMSKGADINAKDEDGRTPLMRCMEGTGRIEIVKVLIQAGSDINATDNDGHSAVSLAVVKCQELVPALLEAGGTVDFLFIHGWSWRGPQRFTPLLFAVGVDCPDTIFLKILQETGPKFLNYLGPLWFNQHSALEVAIARNLNLTLIRKMVEQGCDPNQEYREKYPMMSPASLAVNKELPVFRVLLLHGARRSCRPQGEVTCSEDPIHIAAKKGRYEHLKMLLLVGGTTCKRKRKGKVVSSFSEDTKKFIREYKKEMRTLQELSRTQIWRCMDRVAEGIKDVEIPEHLKGFVMLDDLVSGS